MRGSGVRFAAAAKQQSRFWSYSLGFVELDKALFRKVSATTKRLRSQLWICSARRASRRLLCRNSDAAICQGGDEDSRWQPHPALLQPHEHAPLHERA